MPFTLVAPFQPTGDQPQAIANLTEGLRQNRRFQTLLGVTGSGKTFTLANVIAQVQRPTLVIAHNKTLAAQLCGEFREFFPHNAVEFFISYYDYYQPEAYLPQTDTYIEKDVQINEEIDRMRHSATRALLTRNDVIVVASVSCIYGLGMPEDYFNAMIKVATPAGAGQQLPLHRVGLELAEGVVKTNIRDRDDLIRQLVQLHYERHDFELKRGTFRVRGDSIDIYPVYQSDLIRVTFFGDEVESILELDQLTGEKKANHDVVYIYPASHYVTVSSRMEKAMAEIEKELSQRVAELESQGRKLEAHRLTQKTNYDLEMIREMGYCSGIENYSRHMESRKPGDPPSVLLDYFPSDFLLIMDESHMTVPQIRGMFAGDRSRKDMLIDYGFRLPSARDNRPLTFDEFERKIHQVIFMSATPTDYEITKSKDDRRGGSMCPPGGDGGGVVEQIIRPTGLVDPEVFVRPTEGQIENLLNEIRQRVSKKERVLVTTLTKRMSEDLSDYFSQQGVKVRYLHSDIEALDRLDILHELRAGMFDVLVGVNLLREGLDLPEVSLVAVLDADKEGFLRAERSLIQMIGRAARNINGQVIFYAEKITDSMRHAIEETNRRRRIQLDYNERHGIIPQSIIKEIKLTQLRQSTKAELESLKKQMGKFIHPDQLPQLLKRLEDQMLEASRNLEFEKAAVLRDEMDRLKNSD